MERTNERRVETPRVHMQGSSHGLAAWDEIVAPSIHTTLSHQITIVLRQVSVKSSRRILLALVMSRGSFTSWVEYFRRKDPWQIRRQTIGGCDHSGHVRQNPKVVVN